MLKNKILFAAIALVVSLSACQKTETYDKQAQLKIDTEIITKFVADQKLVDVKQSNGLFYQIIKPGTGTETVLLTDTVTVNYEGRLLNGTVFDKTTTAPIKFTLGQVIEGWQVGVPLIKQGGQIRLIIPSTMAYTNVAVGGVIPANSPLDFTIDLVKVSKQIK